MYGILQVLQAAFSCNPILVSYCHLSHSPSHVLAAIKSLLLLLLCVTGNPGSHTIRSTPGINITIVLFFSPFHSLGNDGSDSVYNSELLGGEIPQNGRSPKILRRNKSYLKYKI